MPLNCPLGIERKRSTKGDVAQRELFPSKCDALHWIPSTTKEKENKKQTHTNPH